MFKNLSIYKIGQWLESGLILEDALENEKFESCNSTMQKSCGWVPLREDDDVPARDSGARDDFAWRVVKAACETEPADEDDPECIRILRLDLKSAVLAAFLSRDAMEDEPND